MHAKYEELYSNILNNIHKNYKLLIEDILSKLTDAGDKHAFLNLLLKLDNKIQIKLINLLNSVDDVGQQNALINFLNSAKIDDIQKIINFINESDMETKKDMYKILVTPNIDMSNMLTILLQKIKGNEDD